jgi:hypothetical protein
MSTNENAILRCKQNLGHSLGFFGTLWHSLGLVLGTSFVQNVDRFILENNKRHIFLLFDILSVKTTLCSAALSFLKRRHPVSALYSQRFRFLSASTECTQDLRITLLLLLLLLFADSV